MTHSRPFRLSTWWVILVSLKFFGIQGRLHILYILTQAFWIRLASSLEALTVEDVFDEDSYMRPPIDVRYHEPLWLAGITLSDFMDISDDMDIGKYRSMICCSPFCTYSNMNFHLYSHLSYSFACPFSYSSRIWCPCWCSST